MKIEMLEMSLLPKLEFRCEICNIEAPNQQGLDFHLFSRKHQEKADNAT